MVVLPVALAVSLHAGDALRLALDELHPPPNKLVANLPYNVAVPALLHLLAGDTGIE